MFLSVDFKIVIPVKDNEGQAIDYKPYALRICEAFNGATVFNNCEGLWPNQGILYDEAVRVLIVSVPFIKLFFALRFFRHLALDIKRECNQGAVYYNGLVITEII